jgi:hypothetical protein
MKAISRPNEGVQKVEIKSVKQMETFISDLETTASSSLKAALSAQLSVIRYINSPQLQDSAFDLLFQNLKKAKEYAETPQQRDEMAEKVVLMIQNYMFFMNAKLTYAIKENKEEGRRLYAEAGKMLAKSVTQIANSYVSSMGTVPLNIAIADSLFKNPDEKLNLFGRFLDWWNQESINQEKQEEFYKSLVSLIKKLNKRREIIGQSNLISGLIENYAQDITDYATSDSLMEIIDMEEERDNALKKMKRFSIGVLIGSVVLLFLRWIWHLLQDAGSGVMSWFSDNAEVVSRDGWVANHFIWTAGFIALFVAIYSVIYLIHNLKCRKKSKEYEKERNIVYNTYMTIAENFEE